MREAALANGAIKATRKQIIDAAKKLKLELNQA